MESRAKRLLTGTFDARDAIAAEARVPAGGPSIDGAGPHEMVELRSLLQAIAARLDVVLGERVAAAAEPEARDGAVEAWASVVGERGIHATSDLRSRALATTVLRISADGRLDLDDLEPAVGHEATIAKAESQPAPDRQRNPSRFDARAVDDAAPSQAAVISVCGVTPELPSPAATDRSNIDGRLRAVRERLAARQASASASHVDAVRRRSSDPRVPSWRRSEIRTLVQRLLIGLAVVGASAVVSILVI